MYTYFKGSNYRVLIVNKKNTRPLLIIQLFGSNHGCLSMHIAQLTL